MESLIAQFTFLSDQSLNEKNFDPSTIEDLMKLFEIESYKAWAAMELEQETQVQEAESAMGDAEKYLDSAMESAMEEFRRFEEEMERESRDQLRGLVQVAEKARRMGNSMEKAASFASKNYIEAALNSAAASMKSAVKAVVTSNSKKEAQQEEGDAAAAATATAAMGIDLKAGGKSKRTERTALRSDDIYLKLFNIYRM